MHPKQRKVSIPGKQKPKQAGDSSISATVKTSPAVAEAQASAALAAATADGAAEAAAAAQQKLVEYAKTLETAEQLKRQTEAEAAAVTARGTADSAPLHADRHTDEHWATDTTAIQLFMDEYKDAIEAVDSAVDRAYSAKLISGAVAADPSTAAAVGGEAGFGNAAEESARGALKPEAAEAAVAGLTAQQAGTNEGLVATAESAAAGGPIATGHQQQQVEAEDYIKTAASQAAASVVADAMATAAKNALIARADEDAARRADSVAGSPQRNQRAAADEWADQQTETAPACGCRCVIM